MAPVPTTVPTVAPAIATELPATAFGKLSAATARSAVTAKAGDRPYTAHARAAISAYSRSSTATTSAGTTAAHAGWAAASAATADARSPAAATASTAADTWSSSSAARTAATGARSAAATAMATSTTSLRHDRSSRDNKKCDRRYTSLESVPHRKTPVSCLCVRRKPENATESFATNSM
jgi:hypothetical protein